MSAVAPDRLRVFYVCAKGDELFDSNEIALGSGNHQFSETFLLRLLLGFCLFLLFGCQ